jgi:Protein of unknown function (DUF3631)/Toprim domain
MPRTAKSSQLAASLGLPDAELARAATWMPEIAIDLSPGVRHYQDGEYVRIGRKGSLRVRAGYFRSYEFGEVGFDAAAEIAFLRPDWELAQIREYLVGWLRGHSGVGSSILLAEEEELARSARNAAFGVALAQTLPPLTGTPADPYGVRRCISLERHGLLGWISDDSRPGEGALVAVGRDMSGELAFVQLGYLNALGEKVEVRGTERRQYWINRDAVNAGFYVRPDPFDPDDPLFLCEGLENCLSLGQARPAARIIGLPGIGYMQYFRAFKGQRILVFRDGDAEDSPARRALLKGLDALLLGGAVVTVTDTPDGEDPNSLLQKGGIEAIEAVLATAEPAKLSPRGVIARGAGLRGIDYEVARKDLAKEAGVKVTALDDFVRAERDRRRESMEIGPQRDVHPEPVDDITAVLDTARAEIAKYVVAAPEQLDMVTMWSLHTHFVHHRIVDIAISPRLAVTAPTADCGKTTLLEACGELSHRAQECSNITAAGFFHLHQEERRTLLIDEAQAILGKKGNDSELQGILLASHRRRSAKVIRAVEVNKQYVSKEFDAWCTFAMTYTGKLAYALETRCLKVTLRRAKPGEVEQHLQYGTSKVLVDCRRKFARWAEDQLSLPNAELPKALYNRRGDNWRPLFQIAEAVGGRWPRKIKAAALADDATKIPPDKVVALLTDTREIMHGQYAVEILTADLLTALKDHPEPSADWRSAHRGGPINEYWLREALDGILFPPGSQSWWLGKHRLRGYRAQQFADAYERYAIPDNYRLPPENISAEGGESSDPSAPSALSSKKPGSGLKTLNGADADGGVMYPSAPSSHPRPGADRATTPLPASAPREKHSSAQKKTKGGADGADQADKTRPPQVHAQTAKKQPKSIKVDETW